MFKSITRSVSSSRPLLMVSAATVLTVAALGFSSGAHARGEMGFSVGVSTPGVVIGVSNAYPVYTAPVYDYHQQPAYRPHPVYVQAPIYVAPPPVYYRGGHHYRDDDNGHRGYRSDGHGRGHGNGHRR